MSVNLLIKLLIVVVPFLQVLVVLFVKLFVLINLLCNLLYNLLHISPNVVNKTIPSVDASETFCTIVKSKNKFYQLLILPFGDVSLNPGPSQYLPDNDNKFEHFCKWCLHFLYINVNQLLSKVDELRPHQTWDIRDY